MALAKQEFTNAGRSMLGRAQNGEVLTITKIVVGQGSAVVPSDLWPLTALIDYVMDVDISVKRDYGDGKLLVEGSFRSDEAPSAFFLHEVGVMAHIGAESDSLYSVANVLLDPPDYIDPAAPTIQAFKIKLVIDRIPTGDLVVQIGPSENVLGENIGADTVGPGVFKEAIGNVLYFKRLVEGDGIRLTQDVDEETITVATRQLTTNVDLYVPEDHPGAPNPDVAFPTIQEAHDYLLQFRIPADKTATIHVYSGTFTVAVAIKFNHPDSKQITVKGEPRVDKVVGSIQYVNATTKRMVIADNSGLVAGRKGWLANCAAAWSGGCQITGVPHPNDVLCTTEKRDSRGNYTTNDTSGAIRFSYLPTVIETTEDPSLNHSLFDCPFGIRSFENILVVGGGFGVSGGTIKDCHAWGCTRGISGLGGTQLSGENVITQCDFGITGTGPIAAFDQTYINACTQAITPSPSGFAIGSITTGMPDSKVYVTRSVYVANAGVGASLQGGSFLFAWNDTGFKASVHSIILLGSAYGSVPQNNGIDLWATGLSFIQYDRHGEAAPTVDPAVNPGNQGSWIEVLNS